jgi:phosphatidylglycerophosphate synthase
MRAPEDPPATRWKERLDDPLNRLYRYPLARLIVRRLVATPVTPNEVSWIQPLFAAAAGGLVASDDRGRLLLGAALFEIRSVLDCVDGTLARATKHVTPGGHVVDGVADWLGTALLYAGIFVHFHLHPPPPGAWSRFLSVDAVLVLALAQGALRSFAADHYKRKYVSVFEHGQDEAVASLGQRARAAGAGAPFFTRADALLGRAGHLIFEHERFDAEATGRAADRVLRLRAREGSPACRAIAMLWSVSNGDAFLSLVVLSLVLDRLWEAQLFFATAGVAWIGLVIVLNARFARGAPLLR